MDKLSTMVENDGLVSDEEGMEEEASLVIVWILTVVLAYLMSKGKYQYISLLKHK